MPSFLNDDSEPVFSAESDILNLDFANDLDFASKVKSTANGAVVDHTRTDISNESLDGSSTLSTRDSNISDTTPMPANGSVTRPTSMSSLAKSKTMHTGTDARDAHKPSKSRSNGATILADRTEPRLSNSNDHTSPQPNPAPQPIPLTQPAQMQVPMESANGCLNRAGHESVPPPPPPPSSKTQLHGTKPSSTTVVPQPQSLEPGPKDSPNRFSSPPAVQHAGTSVPASSSGHLQPPAGGLSLKQRHTLEVPRLPPNRQSKDGGDAAYASGRFSPSVSGSVGTRRASLNLVRRTTRSMHSDVPRDEMAPDEDAIRWAEAYRQRRASKRKRKEEEDDDRVLVGTKVDESHANWVTAYNMLTGIRVSVSRTNAKLDRELTDADFDAQQKSTFDM